MTPTLTLLAALLQPAAAPAPVPAPATAAAPATAPAPAPTDVAKLRDHLQRLVDARAEKAGGPRFVDNDKRLATLRAMLNTAANRPDIPLPRHVWEARTLEELWGSSTALFNMQLLIEVSHRRPSGAAADAPTCARVCKALTDLAGNDTVMGVRNGGWPMPDEAAAAIRGAASATAPECQAACLGLEVPNPECVAAVKRPTDLERCWVAPPPPPGSTP